MELTFEQARRRLWQHRVLRFLLSTLASLMLVVFGAKATVDYVATTSGIPGPLERLFGALGQASELPFVSIVWSFAPGLGDGRLTGVLLSPYIWVCIVLTTFSVLERKQVGRIAAAVGQVRIVPPWQGREGNQIGVVRAGGNVHITQTVHEKPNERPLVRLMLSTAVSAVVAGVFGLIKAWMGL